MRRASALETLRDMEADLRRQGVDHLYLFGSVARDEADGASDVDVAFDVEPSASERFSLIDQSRIRRQLVEALSVPVDLVERAYLRPRIGARAKTDMVRVF